MRYWLYKSEPNVYGIDHLKRDDTTTWDGVRNFRSRNNLTAATIGDQVFFYHSSANPPGIAGLAEVIETFVVDPLQFDQTSEYFDSTSLPDSPRWITVRVKFVEKFPRFVSLEELRRTFLPSEMPILAKGSRLSVTPVGEVTAQRIVTMARA